MKEDQRPDLSEILKHLEVATSENIRPGDLAQFQIPRHTPFLVVESVSRGWVWASHAGRPLSTAIVVTQDIPPRVLFGAEVLRQMREECVRNNIEGIQKRAESFGFSVGTTEETRPFLESLAEDMLKEQ